MNTKDYQVFQNASRAPNELCRFCGRQDLKVIDIYSEEGMRNDILNKIEMYIPIKLEESKEPPFGSCLECMSTILCWHKFVLKVLETNQKLSTLKNVISRPIVINDDSEIRDLVTPSSTSLQAFRPDPKNEIPECLINNIEYTDVDDSDHETAAYSYISADLSKEVEEEIENGAQQEIKTSITTQSHNFEPDLESQIKRLNHTNEISENEDCQIRLNNSVQTIRSKIDPKIIEAAKVIIGDRAYYNCKECGKSLLSPYTYVWHMRIHTGERPFMCDLCGKQFRVSQGLVRHLKETHKRIKNFPCDLCGRMFATKRNVDEHRRIHTNERPYVCALCSKSFKQKASLFVHNRTHSDIFPFKCEYCNQGFRTKPPLLIHVTKHTGQKPFPCDICGRYFRIKYELKRHKLVHSEEKPFVCSCCGLRFKQKRYLRNHFKANHSNAT